MIFLKLLLIVSLCYIIAKGLASEAERHVIEANKRAKDIQDAAKEAYQRMQAEKTILTSTIIELRKELDRR